MSTKKTLLVILYTALLFPVLLAADSSRIRVSNLTHMEQILHAATTSQHVAIRPGTLTTYVNGLGRITFNFNEIKKSTITPEIIRNGQVYLDTGPVVLMKGWAMLGNTPLRAAGMLSFEHNRSTLTLDFPHTSKHTAETTLYRLVFSNLTGTPKKRMERTKQLHFNDVACGNDTPLINHINNSPVAPLQNTATPLTANSTFQEIKVSAHIDSSYINSFGSSTSYIQGILNAAETIYEDNLALRFSLVRVVADNTLFFSSGEGVDLLIDFANYIDITKGLTNSADVFHVFTGKDILGDGNSNVIGVAFIGFANDPDPGVVCRPDRFTSIAGFRPAAVGASERNSSSTAGSLMVTFAHEMGHNFSALHTSSGIMTASLNFSNLPGAFSSDSRQQISGYVSQHGSCLTTVAEPDPDEDDSDDNSDDDSSDGGSSGGGVDGNVPEGVHVELSHSLDQEGLFRATISIDEDPGANCFYRVLMNTKKNSGRGIVLVSTEATNRSHTFLTQTDKKARRRNRKGRRVKVWVTGVYECNPGVSGSSTTELVKAHRVKARRRVGAKRWIKLLRKQFL